VLHPDDAVLALKNGAHGIIVSNHGGRQLDYSPSALDMLPAVVAAVRRYERGSRGGGGGSGGSGRAPILMDGGIRRGTDVVKALALGADAVMLGRPVLYGLAAGGQEGVEKVRVCGGEGESVGGGAGEGGGWRTVQGARRAQAGASPGGFRGLTAGLMGPSDGLTHRQPAGGLHADLPKAMRSPLLTGPTPWFPWQVLSILHHELQLAMALCGAARVSELGPRLLLEVERGPRPVQVESWEEEENEEQEEEKEEGRRQQDATAARP
jgi:hypothetical protein